ncbi:unnamed protein product, partial [Prorocentrum cordatum]
ISPPILLPLAVRPCGSSPSRDTDEGSCGAPSEEEEEVAAREAQEAAALRAELLQKAHVARRGAAALAWPEWPASPDSPGPAPAPPASDPNLARASEVCVENRGGFRLSFELWDTETNQRMPATAAYAMGGQDCRSLGAMPMIEAGHPIVAVVYIEAGATITLSPVIYDPDLNETAGSATLTCRGGTGTPTCLMDDAEVRQLPPPQLATWQPVVRASQICLTNNGGYRLRFQLWNTAWNTLSPMSDSFDLGSSKCMSADFTSGLQEGNPLVPITHVQGGMPQMFHSVLYDATASAASYNCGGATGGYSCTLLGV